MADRTIHLIRHGPLEAYVRPVQDALELSPVVQAVHGQSPCVWLDSARPHPVTGRWSFVGWDPWLTLSAFGSSITLRTTASVTRWQANPLQALRRVLHRYRAGAVGAGSVAAAFGLLGYLSYELNRWIERLPAPRRRPQSAPEMLWYGMRMTVLIDHGQGRSWIVSLVDPHQPHERARRVALRQLEQWGDVLKHPDPVQCPEQAWERSISLEATISQARFERMVGQALELIRSGDIFQVNLAQQFTARWSGSSLPVYLALRRINPSPFSCFLSWADGAIVSCSPERLVRVEDGWVETRPIAGTRPRGGTPEEDATNSFELLMSDKERAEHIMLVDLARNDLGRVCRPGSVSVDELMTLEDYSHVIHIVSNVGGQLRAGVDPVDVVRAVFPGGTITGCPKVRAMEVLRALEPVARGVYTGSVGRVGFDGTMDLNIAIRTLVIEGCRLSCHVGAGIVADSKPDREYRETLAKAEALLCALRSAGSLRGGSHAVVG